MVEPTVLDLNDLILDMDKMLRHLISEDIELVTLPGPDLAMIEVDPRQMEQVLVNLAVNARGAMPNGGKLMFETAMVALDQDYLRQHPEATAGEHVVLTVTDTGIGMTQEVKAHAFEPFFTTKEVGKGTGLGLSTCHGIVAQSGGHIAVESEPGRGATFRIYLPSVDEPAAPLPLRDETGYLPVGTETVLLVEDEPLVRRYAARVLRKQGYTVLEAANGHEALSVAHAHDGEEIHLLLTDVVMPLMGGRELADQLRAVRPETKVLYASGYAGDAIVDRGALEPDSALMQKPVTPAVLARKVREMLDRD